MLNVQWTCMATPKVVLLFISRGVFVWNLHRKNKDYCAYWLMLILYRIALYDGAHIWHTNLVFGLFEHAIPVMDLCIVIAGIVRLVATNAMQHDGRNSQVMTFKSTERNKARHREVDIIQTNSFAFIHVHSSAKSNEKKTNVTMWSMAASLHLFFPFVFSSVLLFVFHWENSRLDNFTS